LIDEEDIGIPHRLTDERPCRSVVIAFEISNVLDLITVVRGGWNRELLHAGIRLRIGPDEWERDPDIEEDACPDKDSSPCESRDEQNHECVEDYECEEVVAQREKQGCRDRHVEHVSDREDSEKELESGHAPSEDREEADVSDHHGESVESDTIIVIVDEALPEELW